MLLALFMLFAAWEWAAIAGLERPAARASYVGALALLGCGGVLALLRLPAMPTAVGALALLWWLWALIDLARAGAAPRGAYRSLAGRLAGGAVVLVPAWLASVSLHADDPRSPALVLYLFSLVWVADTGAYFVGRKWGRSKLAPTVSPGKTIEGLIGALGAVVALSYFCGRMVWQLSGRALLTWIAVALATLAFSVIGDLVESKLKRLAGVKDSGTWLPGHGGVLDRIDALTAAAPIFLLGWSVFLKMPS